MTIQRWTDEMLDNLASSVTEMHASMTEMRGSMTEMRSSITELKDSMTEMRGSITEVKDSITEVKDSVDGLRITAQALLQAVAQSQKDTEWLKQKQAETDQRFNVLLEEVRYLIHHDNRRE